MNFITTHALGFPAGRGGYNVTAGRVPFDVRHAEMLRRIHDCEVDGVDKLERTVVPQVGQNDELTRRRPEKRVARTFFETS